MYVTGIEKWCWGKGFFVIFVSEIRGGGMNIWLRVFYMVIFKLLIYVVIGEFLECDVE